MFVNISVDTLVDQVYIAWRSLRVQVRRELLPAFSRQSLLTAIAQHHNNTGYCYQDLQHNSAVVVQRMRP